MGDPSISILTVDDEPGLAESIQMILISEGYSAFMEMDGYAAVNFCKANRPDVALIDVALGDKSINGLEVLKRVKELKPDTICVMITRMTDNETIETATKLGAFKYILKPLRPNDITFIADEAAEIIRKRRVGNG